MDVTQAILLGIIQGITEFLPISSSGHLIFVPKLFGWQDQGLAFDAILHLGSLTAVIFYFRNKLWLMLKAFFTRGESLATERKLAWFVVLATLPAGLFGLLAGGWIESRLRTPLVIAIDLIVWGVLLGVADYVSRKQKTRKKTEKLTWVEALGVGVAQAIALFPGTSRSGITMTAGLFSKLDRNSAAEFSFLMSVPIITLGGLLKLVELFGGTQGGVDVLGLTVGFVAAALSGFFAIAGLMKLIKKYSFMPFVYYRLAVGVLILIFLV